MFNLNGKVAIVTGGANGIGLAYVKEFLKNELKGVTIADINEEQGRIALKELRQEFGESKVIFVRTDVSDKLQIKNAFDKTIEVFHQFDVLVNNAGIINELDWEKCLNINFIAVMCASQLAIQNYFPKYKNGEEAVILNVGSSCSFVSEDSLSAYSASKHGVVGFTKSCGPISHEATKVKVVCICPSATNTDLLVLKENQTPAHLWSLYKEVKNTLEPQSTDVVAKAALKLIREQPSGTVWTIEAGKIREIPNTLP